MESLLEIKVITNERYSNHISYRSCSNCYSRKALEAMTYFKIHVKDKLDIIAHVLTRNGITVWYGIPEQIVAELKANGYKIKKRKHLKKYIPKDQPNL
jgi:hypothetical protein